MFDDLILYFLVLFKKFIIKLNFKYFLSKKMFFIENNTFIYIIKNLKCIKINKKNRLYAYYDILHNFDLYFNAVKYQKFFIFKFIDFSQMKLHDVIGYNLHQVMVPSIMEPVDAVKQYINFFNLNEDSVVLDLGSYSGLTAILFDKEICKNNLNASGKVITVEADKMNLKAVKHNISSYFLKTERNIEIFFGAIWNKDGELDFSSEGALGSAAIDVLNSCRGKMETVPSYKLSTIANTLGLKKVDCIKCDIEGAEGYMVEDKEFFEKYKPRIIMELHEVSGDKLFNKVKNNLEKHGYSVKKVVQEDGFTFPLVECLFNKEA